MNGFYERFHVFRAENVENELRKVEKHSVSSLLVDLLSFLCPFSVCFVCCDVVELFVCFFVFSKLLLHPFSQV